MSFQAKYRGRCEECDHSIEPGDACDYNADDQVVHTSCLAISSSVPEESVPACGGCHTVHAVHQKDCW